jgi:3-dehydro-L-gulonate 2-dehydrogenase
MQRIPYLQLQETIERILVQRGFSAERAALSARLFAETTRDGVYTHGLNRFPRFLAMIDNGCVVLANAAHCSAGFGALERWEGEYGPGNLNAYAAMERACALAREHGIGCVALAHTNHWMRGGTYGWQAAEQGLFAICWTNTNPNMPAWGATAATLGNNPLVLAVPRRRPDAAADDPEPWRNGPHVVLDMAISQFSYGQIDAYAKRGEELPVPGGFSKEGELTRDPVAIRESYRALPIGFWKGSGLALTLDLFAAMLSGGHATHEIDPDPLRESGVSQIFVAVAPANISHAEELARTADALIEALHDAPPVSPGVSPRYPGEETRRVREENMQLGLPVDEDVWATVCAMLL